MRGGGGADDAGPGYGVDGDARTDARNDGCRKRAGASRAPGGDAARRRRCAADGRAGSTDGRNVAVNERDGAYGGVKRGGWCAGRAPTQAARRAGRCRTMPGRTPTMPGPTSRCRPAPDAPVWINLRANDCLLDCVCRSGSTRAVLNPDGMRAVAWPDGLPNGYASAVLKRRRECVLCDDGTGVLRGAGDWCDGAVVTGGRDY